MAWQGYDWVDVGGEDEMVRRAYLHRPVWRDPEHRRLALRDLREAVEYGDGYS
jgi:hypothetical protein